MRHRRQLAANLTAGYRLSYPALITAASICGAIVGVEREKKLKPAGLRTMILIALGSTLFTLLRRVAIFAERFFRASC